MAEISKARHEVELTSEQISKVKEYVVNNYKQIKDPETLLVTASVSGVFVRTNKDSSPLILNPLIMD